MPDKPSRNIAESYEALWHEGLPAPDPWTFLSSHPDATPGEVVDVLLSDQQRRYEAGCPFPVEHYLAGSPTLAADPERKLDLVYGDYRAARQFGPAPDPSALAARFPDLADALARHMALDALLTASERESEGTAFFDCTTPRAGDELCPSSGDFIPISDTFDTTTNEGLIGTAAAKSHIGRFTLRGRLGAGAFGEVYRAYDPQLDREVALKVAKPAALSTPERKQRFLREAKAAANLRHPNIVPLFDAGEADGHSFIASALIRGRTLEAEIAEAAGKPLELGRAATVIRRLAEALGYAHKQGITHRDVKPANTLVDESGEPHLLDFGLAARDGDDGLQTQEGLVLGTPAYMSPEQAAGNSAEATVACDQYALGVMLFEMATGRRPFAGAMDSMLFSHIHTTPPRPRSVNPAVPRDLETVILKCLEKEPAKRYPSCESLAEDLRRFGAHEPVTARRIGPFERTARWAKRNPAVAGSLAVAALALLLGTGVSLWQADEARGQAARANTEAERADGEAIEARKQETEAIGQARRAELEAANAKSQAKRATTVKGLMAGLFHSSDPTGLSGVGLLPPGQRSRSLTLADLLARGSESLTDTLLDDPLTRASLLDVLGDVNRTMGNRALALSQLRESLKIREEHLPADHEDLATTRYHLGTWHSEGGDVLEAERQYTKVLKWHVDRGTLESSAASEVQLRLSVALISIGDPSSEQLARLALAAREKARGPTDRETEIARMVLASSLLEQGETRESLGLIMKTFQSLASDEAAQKDPVVRATLEYMRALALGAISPVLGEGGLIKACQLMEGALGPDHLYLALPKSDLGGILHLNKKPREAEAAYRESLAIVRKTVGLGHPRAVELCNGFAKLLWDLGRGQEGWELIDEAYTRAKEQYPDEFRWRYRILCMHGHHAGKMRLAEVVMRDAEDMFGLMARLNRPLTEAEQMRFVTLAVGVLYLDDHPKVRDFHARTGGPTGPALGDAVRAIIDHNYCLYLFSKKQYAEVEPLLRNVVRRDPPQARAQVVKTAYADTRALAVAKLAQCCWKSGRFEEAEKWMREAVTLEKKQGKPERAARVSSSLLHFLILRQQWGDVSAVAEQHANLSGRPPAEQSWTGFVQAAASALGPTPSAGNGDLDHIEKLFGQAKDHAVAMNRARAVLLAGGDLKRERDRLTMLVRDDPANAALIELRCQFEIALGDFAGAIACLNASGIPAAEVARLRLCRLLNAYATVKSRPTPESDAALAGELVEVEKYLKATPDIRDSEIAGSTIDHILELHFWSRKIAEKK